MSEVSGGRAKSLSGKLTLSFVLIIFVFLAGTLGLSYLSTKKALYRQFDGTLLARAYLSFRWIEQRNDELRVHERSIRDLSPFGELSWGNDRTILEVRDWRGVVVSRIQDGEGPTFELEQESFETFRSWNIDNPNGVPLRVIAHRFTPRLDSEHDTSYPRREAIVILASDRSRVDKAVSEQGLWLVGIGVCLVGLTGFMVPFVIRKSLAPLDTLAQRAERIEATVLDERFPRKSLPAELLPISDCLNRLLERLERSFRRERNFTSDVAHELLTPVAELRSLAEFSLRYPDENRDESIAQSLQILKRVESIVVTLLDLCRVEQEGGLPEMESISVFALVESALASHVEIGEKRGINWSVQVLDTARFVACPERLEVIVSNLISNAASYADEGTTVRVDWLVNGRTKSLEVTNTAASLKPEQLSHFFERFWRQDSSRADSGHFGLGLSLSRELACSMGFELDASLSSGGELSLRLSAALESGQTKSV